MAEPTPELIKEAVRHHERGELEDASRLYARVLEREPENPDALHLLGVVAHQQGRDEEAVRLITRAIPLMPRSPACRNNLAMALAALGRTAEAERAYREALALQPDFSDALLNLANLRGSLGHDDDAVALLRRAASLAPQSPEVHYNLGHALLAAGDCEGALNAMGRAVDLRPGVADLHHNLGSLRLACGDVEGAARSYLDALDKDPGHSNASRALLACLGRLTPDSPVAEAVLTQLLDSLLVDPREAGRFAAMTLERRHGLSTATADAWPLPRVVDELLHHQPTRLYLRRTVNVSADLEAVLHRARRNLLLTHAGEDVLQGRVEDAATTLAMQCFLNEYVWPVSAEEERAVENAETRILEAWESGSRTRRLPFAQIALYAMYRSLWRLACASALVSPEPESSPPAMAEMLQLCVREPLRERQLAATLARQTRFRDTVSTAVQAQYEENPYPRWRRLTRHSVQSVADQVRQWCPGLRRAAFMDGPMRLLVAGCGTGKEAIDAALHFDRVEVTAIDLSLASLAFARRKAEEYGLDNIRFFQEDILELGSEDGPYHIILSSGVLHHMADPADAMRRLSDLLVPSGLMKLGLYSRLARAPLREAARRIRDSGGDASAGSIRAFRQRVLEEGARGPLGELTGSTDFYSTSECRDLLFHVQELQLDLGEIDTMLRSNGLAFLGFELPITEVAETFRKEHPREEALRDLALWAKFEERHPLSFRSMYQFWCQRER